MILILKTKQKSEKEVSFTGVNQNVLRLELRSRQWSLASPPPAPPWQLSPGPRVRHPLLGDEAEVEDTGTARMGRLVIEQAGATTGC